MPYNILGKLFLFSLFVLFFGDCDCVGTLQNLYRALGPSLQLGLSLIFLSLIIELNLCRKLLEGPALTLNPKFNQVFFVEHVNGVGAAQNLHRAPNTPNTYLGHLFARRDGVGPHTKH